jgi:5-methylcytosine-specific restriction endonuclease McrA
MRKNDGRCPAHHLRWKTHGDVGPALIRPLQRYAPGQTCAVNNCPTAPRVRGWCTKHWDRWNKYGDPLVLVRRERTSVRTCAWCLRTPDQVPFHRAEGSPDGLTARCKWCIKAYQQLYIATKPSGHPRIVKKNASTRQWRARNRDRIRESGRRWRLNNRDIVLAAAERRRRRLRGLDGRIPTLNRRRVWRALRGLCGLCALPVPFEDMQVDHIKPVSKGGSHSYTNVQPSHPACNRRKSNREVAPWAYATATDRRRAEQLLRRRSRSESKSVNVTTPSIFSMSPSLS